MKISFVPGSKDIEDYVSCPEPAKFFIPEWYKKIPGGKNIFNVKKCIPFLDSFSSGYIQKTWTDIVVENKNDNISVLCEHKVPIIKFRGQTDLSVSQDFHKKEFLWQRPWSVVLPENMSALVTHPLNRIDLPFVTLSGIVDFDKSIHAEIGGIPFFIKSGFSGTIPKGTPMFQIIPFQRYDWVSIKEEYSNDFWSKKIEERRDIQDFYKKQIWQKKRFD